MQGTNIGSRRLNLGVVVGELTATEEQYQRWIKIAASFYVGTMGGRRIFVGLKSIAKDGKNARYYWLFTWSASLLKQQKLVSVLDRLTDLDIYG